VAGHACLVVYQSLEPALLLTPSLGPSNRTSLRLDRPCAPWVAVFLRIIMVPDSTLPRTFHRGTCRENILPLGYVIFSYKFTGKTICFLTHRCVYSTIKTFCAPVSWDRSSVLNGDHRKVFSYKLWDFYSYFSYFLIARKIILFPSPTNCLKLWKHVAKCSLQFLNGWVQKLEIG
jgi:hypothetical protein